MPNSTIETMSSKNTNIIHETCLNVLKTNRNTSKRTVVIDFDNSIIDEKNKVSEFANILNVAHSFGYYIFIVSERPPHQWYEIIRILTKNKIPFTSVFTSAYIDEHPIFKIDIREKIQNINPTRLSAKSKTLDLLNLSVANFHKTSTVILCVGDSWLDVLGSGDYIGIKLANKYDNHVYIYKKDKKIYKYIR